MKVRKLGTLALFVAALGLGAGTAFAQTTTEPGTTDTTTTTTTSTETSEEPYISETEPDRTGIYLLLGGGIEDYTGEQGDFVNLGPMAGLYLGLQPFPVIGFEFGYTAGLHNFAVDLRDGSDLIRHGAQAAVTLGAPLSVVKPYALAGIGVDFNTRRATDLLESNTDTGGYVPLGAGLMFASGNFLVDARFTYHVLFDEASFDESNLENPLDGGRYQAQLSLGFTL